MNKAEVMQQLKTLGTEQNRNVYGRHGVKGDQFGVSYAELVRLKKRIGIDQELAEELWATGNHDARVLGAMIADPAQIEANTLDAWVKELDNYVITEAFSKMASGSPSARERMRKWIEAKDEWVGTAGWNVLTHLAMRPGGLPDNVLDGIVEKIEAEIHGSKNRVKYAMNNALIAIGVSSSKLQKKSVEAARRIGRVEVDHGETNCQTPDAAAYIHKTIEHRKKGKTRRRR
ncbi:MAG: DNA alkylation repair protein [Candidatus Latescibacterota bacterium]